MSPMKLIICAAVMIMASSLATDLVAQSIDEGLLEYQIVEPRQEDLVLKVFPNPTPDYVKISSNIKLKGHYKLSNIVGKIILEGVIEDQSATIDLLEYRTGVYIISIYDKKGKKLATRKIIKN